MVRSGRSLTGLDVNAFHDLLGGGAILLRVGTGVNIGSPEGDYTIYIK